MNFPGKITSKLPHVGTTIFTVMSALANEYKAINLSQGFPDFLCDERLMNKVDEYIRKGFNQYAPMGGIMTLRERIAEKMESLYGCRLNPETEITVTPGATEAIYTAVTAVVDKGDEVIVFEPAYDSYVPAVELCKGIPVYIRMEPPDYKIPWEQVKRRISPRTRMLIINSPHNPAGTILDEKDMRQLESLLRKTGIMIISDEVYEHIIFDGNRHESVLRYPGLAERSFAVYSFGKTYHNTGWKMGYCIAPPELMTEFRRVHQFNVFCCNTPYQHAFADIMQDKDMYLGLSSFYQEKRDFFCELLKNTPFAFVPAKGSYFQTVSYKNISDEKDTDYAVRLTKEIGVASVPISVFYHDTFDQKMLRFCFAKKKETLKAAMERLSMVGC
jgi:methionine aminotransferase